MALLGFPVTGVSQPGSCAGPFLAVTEPHEVHTASWSDRRLQGRAHRGLSCQLPMLARLAQDIDRLWTASLGALTNWVRRATPRPRFARLTASAPPACGRNGRRPIRRIVGLKGARVTSPSRKVLRAGTGVKSDRAGRLQCAQSTARIRGMPVRRFRPCAGVDADGLQTWRARLTWFLKTGETASLCFSER